MGILLDVLPAHYGADTLSSIDHVAIIVEAEDTTQFAPQLLQLAMVIYRSIRSMSLIAQT